MESITLGQAFGWISAIAGVIGAVVVIVQWCKKILLSVVKQPMDEIKTEIAAVRDDISKTNESIADVNMNYIKSFLVSILSSAERGEMLTDIEKLRFSEEYDYYRSHNGNSYIKEWYDRLHSKGLI